MSTSIELIIEVSNRNADVLTCRCPDVLDGAEEGSLPPTTTTLGLEPDGARACYRRCRDGFEYSTEPLISVAPANNGRTCDHRCAR